ncbi:demethoxyubiquinone hydroxylase family protein [Rickettsia typhi]|uniref:Ubiquinone biosynthesis protein CoQ7 n=2 Tax=Rickettsia typhi TaxID=785 RepID=Q68XH8_RICTY|nr:demethoxyubiquinone hydroxylase family protein [Rickettsia typhi]AAU03664.1 ubiquinone biosynthesis protein CoQ7 [Rickettsia typhi str. Wilmington]AFE54042.1 ubiquinone biosynthesis protein coq7 [Rickettsia typhi str. TH1527]AFE54881.1 ubiquinone biosynthesis protein coq7 [Rickettsia typhi str. B9991CWPP]
MPRPDFSNLDKQIHDIIRVNHAGEYGAKRIYQGQLKYIKSQNDRMLIKEMLDNEAVHLNFFEKKILERAVRPTVLLSFWHHYGFLLGALSSLIGIKTAMLVTESIEEVIAKHYEQQINYLENRNVESELLNNLIKFRLEEIEHKNIAVIYSTNAIFADIISKIVKIICHISILLSKKI